MIIGKPITFGSGGLMAEISVGGDVLSTDTVTATKGSKTVNGEWVSDHFIIKNLDIGTWLLTATRSGTSVTQSVLIDEIAQYPITISR